MKRVGNRIRAITKGQWIKGICIGMVLAGVAVLMHFYGKTEEERRHQQAVADEIIRLHVIANSDEKEDQELKLKVKETIVTYLRGEMSRAENIDDARQVIRNHLPDIEEIAKEKIEREGYSYTVKTSLSESYFPIKEYGDMIFPAGEYEALRVQIGKSTGRNWWCVMYPTLCFVDSTYQIVPEESKEKLKESLSEEDYESLLCGGEDVTYHSKIWEWIQNMIG